MNPLRHLTFASWRRVLLLGLFVVFSSAALAHSARAQDLYDFNSLASDVARAIEEHSTGSLNSIVLVTEFEERSDPDSQLASVLTQNFSRSLRNHAHDFTVLDRSDVEAAISNRKLPVGALSSRAIAVCYAPDLGATIIIGGRIEYTPENLILDLDVRPSAEGDGILGKRIITPLTPAMEKLKSQPAVRTEAIFGEDKTVWVKDGETQTKNPPVAFRTPGYSYPECVYCPQAGYSDAAVKAKLTGTIVLSVIVGANGTAERISVERALPCGLDQQAIEAVKGWKFKPAIGPDGKPATIVQPVEVTFHMY